MLCLATPAQQGTTCRKSTDMIQHPATFVVIGEGIVLTQRIL